MSLLIITLYVKAILPNSAKDVHVQLIKLNKIFKKYPIFYLLNNQLDWTWVLLAWNILPFEENSAPTVSQELIVMFAELYPPIVMKTCNK